jgi:hypothetical protein
MLLKALKATLSTKTLNEKIIKDWTNVKLNYYIRKVILRNYNIKYIKREINALLLLL